MEKLDNRDKHNDDNDFVHEGNVAGALGIGESVKDSRSQNASTSETSSSSTSAKRNQSSA